MKLWRLVQEEHTSVREAHRTRAGHAGATAHEGRRGRGVVRRLEGGSHHHWAFRS